MKCILTTILIQVITIGFSMNLSGQMPARLPRSVPEKEGVSSAGIIDFLNAVDTGRVELHSFMFVRHGKVIAEGWWNPYGPDYRHIMYSASKTFTATAIGLAVSENRLKITDKVVSFFPHSLPDSVSDYMKILTVRDLLTMSTGQDPEPRSMGNNGDWITTFIGSKPVHKPGTVFKYNNMATFMLSAIVQQVTGQTVFDYLQPRIFQPLAIQGIDWDLNPQGINLGMIGLRLRTEDLAKFGQLLIQGGKWNNKQLIPEQWIKEATSFKITSNDPSNKVPQDRNDWAQGYCYQMWRTRNNGVRLDGMGGQFVIIFPDKDAVIVLTANARSTQDEMDLVHKYLFPAIKSMEPLQENPVTYNQIAGKINALSIKIPVPSVSKPLLEQEISGREFLLADNDSKIQSVYFTFIEGICSIALKRDNVISSVTAGSENWQLSSSRYASLLAPAPYNPSKSRDAHYLIPSPSVKVGATYSWTGEKTLEITTRYVEESIGAQTITCEFSGSGESLAITIGPKPASTPMARPGAQVQQRLRGSVVSLKAQAK